ncbi:MAG: transglutaminase family protein [Sphingomonadales bacterium]
MRLTIDVLLDYSLPELADVLLQVEVAAMADQRIIDAQLTVTSPEPLRATPGEEVIGQRCWALGKSRLTANYTATVEIDRPTPKLAGLKISEVRNLPGLVVPYLMPSRYVESDRFEAFVRQEFSDLQGGWKILAMRDWLSSNLSYVSGASSGSTTASDTFVRREGVCRDYAHLMAAFARAASIPARVVSVYAPHVQPPDFHAVVEVWLGNAWHLVDATGMAEPSEMARIAVGRDATDVAFMTIFGAATLIEQHVDVRTEPDTLPIG